MISLVSEHRAIPIYFELLPKLGSSGLAEQLALIAKVLPLLKEYKKVVLGDREFCDSLFSKMAQGSEPNVFLPTFKTVRIH